MKLFLRVYKSRACSVSRSVDEMSNLILLVLSLSSSLCWGQTNIQGISLQGSSNSYAGNLRIQYNGTWGTICDNGWSLNDAKVACRMLGFSDASCALSNARYGQAALSVPIWMSNLGCSGREENLDNCPFYGWGGNNHYCRSHRDDAGVVCVNQSLLGVPEVSVANTSSRTITLRVTWTRSDVTASSFYRQRFVVRYSTATSTNLRYTSLRYYVRSSVNTTVTLTNLARAKEYSISARLQVVLSSCNYYYYNYVNGNYSDPVKVSTSRTLPPSSFGVRLRSPVAGLDFLGRVEVFYRGQWGTVCDNLFDIYDAHVICNMLNFTRALCAVSNARLGRGSGKIWLNRLSCSRNAEILDDCSYTTSITYRSYYYSRYYRYSCSSSHSDDAGVVCMPNDRTSFASAPQQFRVNSTIPTSIRFSWKRYIIPTYSRVSWRMQIKYTRSDRAGRTYTAYPSRYSTSYIINYLTAGITVNASLRVQGRFSTYSCYSYIDGEASDSVELTTVEIPPSSPPLRFHVSVVNCTAIHAEWQPPRNRNGIIRGYKLMYKTRSEEEVVLNLTGSVTEYVIGNLSFSTIYEVSVLAYTVGDGPRSIFLSATTNDENICQTDIIDFFGISGNDNRDKATIGSYSSLVVFCGSQLSGVKFDWYFSNGTKVGTANRNVREGHFDNGTAVLQIGRFGRVTSCDADTYVCRANQTATSRVQQKTFKVTYGYSPPLPDRPKVLNVTSTSVTVSLSRTACDGNHKIQSYTIRIQQTYSSYSYYRTISNVDVKLHNITVTGLSPLSSYYVSLRSNGQDNTYGSYSSYSYFTTLRPMPSPPRAVSVEMVAPNVLAVRWIRPAVTTGRLLYYTVYAKPIASQLPPTTRVKRQAGQLQTIAKNFSSLVTSGNLTLPQLGVEYHIQVGSTVLDNGIYRRSHLSALTTNATIFVPIQGLPLPRNVRVMASTNTSITLSWTAPTTTDTINGYYIQFTGLVEGSSQRGNLIRYTHQGNKTVAAHTTSVTIKPLLPDTNYLFRVAVLTTRGEGSQVQVSRSTGSGNTTYERYVYFHIRFGPVFNCISFRQDIQGREEAIKTQIFNHLKKSCRCDLTADHITSGLYSCGQLPHQMIYRTQVMGTSDYSAEDLVGLLSAWVQSGKAYLVVYPFQMMLDPTCPTRLDVLNDPECPVVPVTPHTGPTPMYFTTTEKMTNIKTTEKTTNQKAGADARKDIVGNAPASTVAGFFIGALIAVLLLVLILIAAVLLYFRVRDKIWNRTRNGTGVFSGGSSVRFEQFDNGEDLSEKEFDAKIQDF